MQHGTLDRCLSVEASILSSDITFRSESRLSRFTPRHWWISGAQNSPKRFSRMPGSENMKRALVVNRGRCTLRSADTARLELSKSAAHSEIWRKWRESSEVESAANECKILKRKWMRTVSEFESWCGSQPEGPKTSSIIERGEHLKLRRIWRMKWCREGESNPHGVASDGF